jgi:hypothetical protein
VRRAAGQPAHFVRPARLRLRRQPAARLEVIRRLRAWAATRRAEHQALAEYRRPGAAWPVSAAVAVRILPDLERSSGDVGSRRATIRPMHQRADHAAVLVDRHASPATACGRAPSLPMFSCLLSPAPS